VATPEARLREFLPNARELALLFAARGVACVLAWDNGFRALSDDDYARISIAQRFARTPHFDPSGTSWLPAPFWAYGAAFRAFGTGLGVARGTAIVSSLAATLLVFVAARLLGASKLGALLGAALSSLIVPYSAYLGIAAVPEVPCAALLLFGAATLVRREPGLRFAGSLALLPACLSRYEAWPIATIFAGFCLSDAYRERQLAFAACAALALSGPLAWLGVGQVEHGNALFFVARVTSYRRALGGHDASLLRRLCEFPRLLCSGAAELIGVMVVVAILTRKSKGEVLSYRRCALALFGMLAFLMLGSVRDGVPTHHAGRVLLPIWFFGVVILGSLSVPLVQAMSGPARAVTGLAVLGWTWLVTPFALPGYDLAQRAPELEAGVAARTVTDRALTIDTPDYGYFAVQAGFGTPLGTSVLDDHDPRRPIPNPFSSAQALDRALRDRNASFVIVTRAHAALLDQRCSKQWDNAGFALFQCAPVSR
jgi:hypothetical protein